MQKFKVGDTVKVLLGKDKGREGKIEKIFFKKQKVLVADLNIYKKHVKGQSGRKGGVYDVPRPLPFSKIGVICQKCKKTTKIGFKLVGNDKVRICKKCGKKIELSYKKQAKKRK